MKNFWEGIKKCPYLFIMGVFGVLVLFFLSLYGFGTSFAASVDILFSGLLAITSFSLFTLQRAFNNHVKVKDNPELVVVGQPVFRSEGKQTQSRIYCDCKVANPASTVATIWDVKIESSELRNITWEIISFKSSDIGKEANVPGLVLPNSMIVVTLQGSVHSQKTVNGQTREKVENIKKVKLIIKYRIGNYDIKSTPYMRSVT